MNRIPALCLILILCIGRVSAQAIKISGTVVDESGEPVIGATIVPKSNTKKGVITNINGKFELTNPENNKTIIVSYVGMLTQELQVKPVMRITLAADSKQLNEVVVTGMTKMDKRLFTGATTKLDADKTKLDGVPDVSRALEGKAAGVTVQNVSGTFGTAPKIRVRGATSIYGSSKPLWVVDGVVVEDAVEVSADQLSSGDAVTLISSAIAGLNADDIENFQILKDGSATSIYGARAMAGVIVVTTKKGKTGISKINYTGEFSTRLKPRYSDYNISNSQEQMGIYKEMEEKGWLEISNLAQASSSGIYGRMYQLIDTYDAARNKYALENSEPARNAYLQKAEFRNTDWFDKLFQSTFTQNHAISISSGSEKARLYASLSAMNDPGWTRSSSVERYTANANASIIASKQLTINLLTNGSYRKQKAPGTLSQDVDVVSGEVKRNFDINPFSYAMNSSRCLDPNETYTRNYAGFNIFNELDNNYIDLNITDLKFQGELNWRAAKGLEFSGLAAIRYQSSNQDHSITKKSNQAQAYRAGIDPEDATIRMSNPFLYTDPVNKNALPETVLPEGGIKFRNDFSVRQLDLRGTVTYNRDFGDKRQYIMNLFGGVESNNIDRNALYEEMWGWDGGNVPNINYLLFKQKAEENSVYYSDNWTYGRSLAYFSSGTFSYEGKYTLNLTGRYEGTNKLGKSIQSRWLPTWNVALAWNAHEEKFFKALTPTFSHLTLKTSYSLTADRGPASVSNAEPIYLSYSPWRPFASVKETGLSLDQIGNSELTYEKKHELNIGLDMGFLNNRINMTVDAYARNNYDLIGLIYTQGVGGETAKFANVASMKSNGVEVTVSTKNIVNKDYSWSTDFTFSKTKNEITELASRSNVIQLVSGTGYALKGYPVRALFSIPYTGLNSEGLPTFTNQDGKSTITDINFQEYEKLGFLKYEGPTDPTLTGGFGNLFTYKNFRLNVFITYSFGNKVRLDPVFRAIYSDMAAMPKEFKNRWLISGDENITDIPVIASKRLVSKYGNGIAYAYNAYNYSTERIADGGFVRMKEISLSYDFPKRWATALKISDLQLKLLTTNLFLLYADKKLNGQDPEFMNSGGVATPMPKQFTLTLRLGI
jgi:TonB-linked SusC/RagA family outer membrane protein